MANVFLLHRIVGCLKNLWKNYLYYKGNTTQRNQYKFRDINAKKENLKLLLKTLQNTENTIRRQYKMQEIENNKNTLKQNNKQR